VVIQSTRPLKVDMKLDPDPFCFLLMVSDNASLRTCIAINRGVILSSQVEG